MKKVKADLGIEWPARTYGLESDYYYYYYYYYYYFIILLFFFIIIIVIVFIFIVSGLPEERLQQGNREVGEHEGGVLVGSQQPPPQQQLGILGSKGNLLQLQPFIAVAAAYCYHLQQSPYADFRRMQSIILFSHKAES